MTIRRVIIPIVVAGLGALAYVWIGLGKTCENRVLAEVPSPDGRHRVVVFERSCGATTAFSTQVSVLPAEGALGGGTGNVLIADTDRGQAPVGPGRGPDVR